jgi:hypothetical protein
MRTIRLWYWEDAPQDLQILSDNGGDEDYVVLVPKGVGIPFFFYSGSSFARWGVQTIEREDGSTVLIGCHA